MFINILKAFESYTSVDIVYNMPIIPHFKNLKSLSLDFNPCAAEVGLSQNRVYW